ISEASRIDAELSRATFEAIDLGQLLDNLVRAREERDLNAGRVVAIEREVRPIRVRGVPLRLERVVENLLDNAVSFSPPGGRITIRLEQLGERVFVSVSDEGPGIPEPEREKVFTRF